VGIVLFDFAADAATLRANGDDFTQKVWLWANLLGSIELSPRISLFG
jgi:hypothetical protein